MKVAILEKIFEQDQEYKKRKRDSHLTGQFNTFYCGLNKNPKLARLGFKVTLYTLTIKEMY